MQQSLLLHFIKLFVSWEILNDRYFYIINTFSITCNWDGRSKVWVLVAYLFIAIHKSKVTQLVEAASTAGGSNISPFLSLNGTSGFRLR
ncbi:MAG: hypothetical protein ACI8RD_004837 [Bacillariaceae sp.]|jgi:hypothetical protein